ncbi:MAG TPA: hypothetical protein VMR18_02305 [Candidatus Saccharimonadales bacterium]|nr:hypothetical protein [Candidatus Saccharimonadales bacterium]
MPSTQKYFQDKSVLLLLTLNLFLVFLDSILIILRLGSDSGEGFIVQLRSNLVIGEFKTGGVIDFLYFIIFAVFVLIFHFILSKKIYKIRRQFSITVLSMGVLLLVITLIVSNALIVLR